MAQSNSAQHKRYLVGIDLGTTHTALAAFDSEQAEGGIEIFPIDQLIAAGEVANQSLLPSVRYHPALNELESTDCNLPWQRIAFGDPVDDTVIGQFGRVLGAKSHGRLVTSAKSWLSNETVDRTADILPWGSAEDVAKVSPVTATASYLNHLRCAWNIRHPDAALENQDVYLAIPASFDEAARQYTLQAAQIAGLHQVHLIEEPLAACYHWTYDNKTKLAESLNDVNVLLVCDVGGGTTDFTLIQVQFDPDQKQQQPTLTRIGVGDHLMLGGDNIDLALARIAEHRLSPKSPLKSADLHQLIEQCRLAKERLLRSDGPEQATITLLGSGSRLIGGSKSTELSKKEVIEIVLDGFFPAATIQPLPPQQRAGVVEFGLPYASDPAITRHIADFLDKHQHSLRKALNSDQKNLVPDAILLNGGLFKSEMIVQTLMDVVNGWSSQPAQLLQNPAPELAVAYGAVAYGLARRGQHIKIGGGSARSFFVMVEDRDQRQQAVCILPKGTEEGHSLALKNRAFALQVGQPVRFHLLSTTDDTEFEAGQLIDLQEQDFHSLPPLATSLDSQGRKQVTVHLSAELSELGVLELSCVDANDQQQRWLLNFELRSSSKMQNELTGSTHPRLNDALDLIKAVFGKKSQSVDPKAVKKLRANLESVLGDRKHWDIDLLRALHAELLACIKNRRRSVHHERIWISLSGFCLRPGYGYPLDDWRCEQMWAIYQHGLQYVNETQLWNEWWTMWRRIAGGLEQQQQNKLFHDVSKYIDPASARQGKTAATGQKRGFDEMLRMVASLEHLAAEDKVKLGGWLLKRLKKQSESVLTWWALSRIGARIPLYGSAHTVVPVETVEQWLQLIIDLNWSKNCPFAFAAVHLARKSGDRSRDISESTRQNVINRLQSIKAPQHWIDMVEQVVELNEAEQSAIRGDSLPVGLTLIS